MRGTRRMAGLLAIVTITAATGCSAISGPEIRSVAGTWTGDFSDSPVRMVLTQSGDVVSGTMDVGSRTYAVTGTVSTAGTFAWRTDTWPSDCTSYATVVGFQLEATANMNGVARRLSSAPPCGSASRLLIAEDTMTLVPAR